jgi:hypothetical protein
MKKTLALLAIVTLTGCFTTVRGERLPREYDRSDESDDADGPALEASIPSSSSSGTKMPSATPTSEGDASAEPAASCQGFASECSSFEGATCGEQRGCVESLGDGTCYGAPTPCSWLTVDSACESQSGCTWVTSAEPRPPR